MRKLQANLWLKHHLPWAIRKVIRSQLSEIVMISGSFKQWILSLLLQLHIWMYRVFKGESQQIEVWRQHQTSVEFWKHSRARLESWPISPVFAIGSYIFTVNANYCSQFFSDLLWYLHVTVQKFCFESLGITQDTCTCCFLVLVGRFALITLKLLLL